MDNLSLYLIIYIVVSQFIVSILLLLDANDLFTGIIISILFPILGVFIITNVIIQSINRKLNPPEPFDEDKFIERFNRVMNEDFGDDDKDEQTKDKEL